MECGCTTPNSWQTTRKRSSLLRAHRPIRLRRKRRPQGESLHLQRLLLRRRQLHLLLQLRLRRRRSLLLRNRPRLLRALLLLVLLRNLLQRLGSPLRLLRPKKVLSRWITIS